MVNKFITWKYDILESQSEFLNEVTNHIALLEQEINGNSTILRNTICQNKEELERRCPLQWCCDTDVNCTCREWDCCSDCPQPCTKSDTCCADSDCCKNWEECNRPCCNAVDNWEIEKRPPLYPSEWEVFPDEIPDQTQAVDTTQDNVKTVKPNSFKNKKRRR